MGATPRAVLLASALFILVPVPVATGAEHAGHLRVLAGQVAGLFPAVDTQVVEVSDGRVTVASGRTQGVYPGLELTAVREGRELYHPTTRKLLGRAEETLGRLVVVTSFEQYAVASATPDVLARLQPGDKARVPTGKVSLALAVLGAVRSPTVEAATSEFVQELERTGRFQIRFADEVAVWLTQERIAPEAFMSGQGVRPAAERFKLGHLLALHFTTQQGKPFMDVRLFSPVLDVPVLQHALFVPPSLKAGPGRQFSTATGVQPEKLERRSLLTRLLSGDFEPNRYSAGAAAIPIRALATFPFLVASMDVAVAPGDRMPRIVVTDGQRVFLYRLKDQVLEPEWTHDKLMVGQILSVQFADLDADGVLEVVVNRQDVKAGMLSYILTTRNGRPALLAGDISILLLAVDEVGDGVNRSLWAQTYDAERFWTRGTATRYVLKKDDIAPAGRALVHSDFRPTGATFSNIAGAERVLAFVDEQSRLVVANTVGQEVWRSQSAVGGGFTWGQTRISMLNMQVDKVFKMEPNPLAVDLDGDGVQEIVVPMNQEERGRIAVVYRGPAGFRMQVVDSGFEGLVSGVGAIPGDSSPTLVAAVLRRKGLLKTGGDTQIIITVPE
ncbi:MAG: FG-GAP repeat domain-containing protein [Candidatus Rokuibacteriota bacterium]